MAKASSLQPFGTELTTVQEQRLHSVPQVQVGHKRSLLSVDVGMDVEPEPKQRKFETNARNVAPEMLGPDGVIIKLPRNISLDMSQCHLWTEHDVSLWMQNLCEYRPAGNHISKTYGQKYADMVNQNGIDGRVLLEFKGIKKLAEICGIHNEHVEPFVAAVNDLRLIRMRCLGLR